MRTSTIYRMIGYFSSLAALLIIGTYFWTHGNGDPVIGLWFAGFLGMIGTLVGAAIGESILDEERNSNKNKK